jgi:aminopeptidase N
MLFSACSPQKDCKNKAKFANRQVSFAKIANEFFSRPVGTIFAERFFLIDQPKSQTITIPMQPNHIKSIHAKMRKTTHLSALLLLLLLAPLLKAQFPETQAYHVDPGGHERNRNIDVIHMKLEVSFDAPKKTVFGKVTHTFEPLQRVIDTIFFDAPGINILQASMDGKPLTFKIIPTGVVVYPNLKSEAYQPMHVQNHGASMQHKITFEYIAKPTKGIYFIGWNLGEISSPDEMTHRQIWTQGQGVDNRYWIPMIDDRSDKFVTETVITFDAKYQVLSNGTLLSKTKSATNNTWHYKLNNPHAGYLLMLAIGDYGVKKSVSPAGTPMQFWHYPEHPERIEPTARYSEQIIDFLSNETGIKYPWITYSQVMIQDFMFGAMENTSATTFGDFFWVDQRSFLERNYITVNAHEATHQWFGDYITGRHDGEQWLQESFATFYPGLFLGSMYGNDEQSWYFREQMRGAIAAGKANSLPVRHSAAGSSRHYPKGASVLYMLQHVLGEENYRKSINLYLSRHGLQTVETWDLQKAIIDATGINMDWFFDQWIHRGGEPIYAVNWNAHPDLGINHSATAGELFPQGQYDVEVHVKQTQNQDIVVGLFRMPVDIEFLYMDGSSEKRTVWVDQSQHTFHFKTPKAPVTVVFDAGSRILKTLEMQKSPAEWLWQLNHGNSMLDRYDALVALRGTVSIPTGTAVNAGQGGSSDQTRADGLIDYKTVLEKAWNREKFREMQVEIATQWLSLPGVFATTSNVKTNQGEQTFGTSENTSNQNAIAIEKFAKSGHSSVRKVLFERLPLEASFQAIFLEGLKDSSYTNIELVVNRLWNLTQPGFISHRDILEAIKDENGYLHNLKVKYFELAYTDALEQQKKQEVSMHGQRTENEPQIFLNSLISMTGPYYEFRTRTNAMAALKRLNVLTPELAQNLFDAILGFNSRLASPAIDLLQYFKQQSHYKALIIKEIQDLPNHPYLGRTYTMDEQKRLMTLAQ